MLQVVCAINLDQAIVTLGATGDLTHAALTGQEERAT
jgi:hypothetical protein